MIGSLFHWKSLLILIAVAIVSGTIVYSRYVAGKISVEERKNVEAWVEAERTILNSSDTVSINLASKISSENKEIPIIETNEQDIPTGNFINIDTSRVREDSNYLRLKLAEFKRYNKRPIVLGLKDNPYTVIHYYYGESELLKEVRWYPIIQLVIVALFIAIAFFSLQTRYRSAQNQLWASMAKETAHQLGTPLSSLEGWLEILKEKKENETIVPEITKDLNRLMLISDRFGKIGSTPHLELHYPVEQVMAVLNYMKKRSSEQVIFTIDPGNLESLRVYLSPTLFDWVFENLLKNALDAMEGKGAIHIRFLQQGHQLLIQVQDTGKGIPKHLLNKVFKAGFTTKKRGWGIGLSLSKRIMEQYHKGLLNITWSELGKGTVFTVTIPLPSNPAQA
ncbi:MAG: HAMP domain-containing histidine kinase [Sphingobacteriia bacterium]|nr:HAMP domain-containing histidine kinase [Sphingobacteriia bacterium]